MPARIIETNPTPLQRVDVDPVTLDIIENALKNARFEMDTVLFRTAMSPGIREQHDEFPLIANRDGKMVVGQFGSFIHGFMRAYDGTIEEGDIFLTTDPYACHGAISHANDWLVLMPIFEAGRHIAWAAMLGHMTDVGGKVPGSLPTDARQIYEEGIVVPPVKIHRRGELQEDLLKLILHNCRLPHWNRSDFNAIVAACRTTAKRCAELSAVSATTCCTPRWTNCSRATAARWPNSSATPSPNSAGASRTTSATTAWAWARTGSRARCGGKASA